MPSDGVPDKVWITINDDEDDETGYHSDESTQDDIDLQGFDFDDLAMYGNDDVDVQYADIHEPPPDFPTTIEVPVVMLDCGPVRAGDVVELYGTPADHNLPRRQGDFLVVFKILENLDTQELYLKGHRLRRVAHYAPLFDRKLNELVVVLETNRYHKKPVQEQGLIMVGVNQVIKTRKLIFTSQRYEEVGIRQNKAYVPLRLQGNQTDVRNWVHDNGPLYARWVYITVKEPQAGKPYGGEVRRLYHREKVFYDQLSRPTSPTKDDDWVILQERLKTAPSATSSQRQGIPSVPKRFTCGDLFSGAGGASYGAKEAGLVLKFGIEIDPKVAECYEQNHPEAMLLCMDAHDFPDIARTTGIFSCDHGHFSTTCKPFSPAHTSDGKKDQENVETIYCVGEILKVVQPSYATAEQTPGLMQQLKHQKYFRIFMHLILDAGYNIRFQVVDLATLGVPQRRRRLLFNISKIGYPMAPFPTPTHGPAGSGLKRFCAVADALYELERTDQFDNDLHHQPRYFDDRNLKPPYDPNLALVGTLTTGGPVTHYSGTRNFTTREKSQFQTFPLEAHLGNSATFGNMVVGNAYPPRAAAQHFLSVAQTHEAFNNKLIDAEEEIHDLWHTLNEKGINIQANRAQGQYRYLNRLEKCKMNPGYMPPSIWGRSGDVEPLPARPRGRPLPLINRARARQRQDVLEQVRDAELMDMIVVLEVDD